MVPVVRVNSMKNGPLGNYTWTQGLIVVEMIFGLGHVSEFEISVDL